MWSQNTYLVTRSETVPSNFFLIKTNISNSLVITGTKLAIFTTACLFSLTASRTWTSVKIPSTAGLTGSSASMPEEVKS